MIELFGFGFDRPGATVNLKKMSRSGKDNNNIDKPKNILAIVVLLQIKEG